MDSEFARVELPEETTAALLKEFAAMVELMTKTRTTDLLSLITNQATYDRIVKNLEQYGQNIKRSQKDIERYQANIAELEQLVVGSQKKIEFYREALSHSKLTVE